MYPRTLCFAIALALSAACGSSSSKPALPPDDAPAGKVIELVGEVAVVEGEHRRELVLGDVVTGGDEIETDEDSFVQIEFFHNGAQWGLGPDNRRRVKDSLAWHAKASAGGPMLADKVGPDRTFAAGRHAERSSATTRATAIPQAEISAVERLEQVAPAELTQDESPEPELMIATDGKAADKSARLVDGDQLKASAKSPVLKKQRNPARQPIGQPIGQPTRQPVVGHGSTGTLAADFKNTAPANTDEMTPDRNQPSDGVPTPSGGGSNPDAPRERNQAQPDKDDPKGHPKGQFTARAAFAVRGAKDARGGEGRVVEKPKSELKAAKAARPSEPSDEGSDPPANAGKNGEKKTGNSAETDVDTATDSPDDTVRAKTADVSDVSLSTVSGELSKKTLQRIKGHLTRQLRAIPRCELTPSKAMVRIKLDKSGKLRAWTPDTETQPLAKCFEVVAKRWRIRLKLTGDVEVRAALTWSGAK